MGRVSHYPDDVLQAAIHVREDLLQAFNDEFDKLNAKLSRQGLSIADLLAHTTANLYNGESAIAEVVIRLMSGMIKEARRRR